MSKWIDKELFDDFQKEKTEEKDNEGFRSENVWATPEKGTTENPKVYEGRFLPDPKGKFYKRYYYHMWQSADESWNFVLCTKSFDWTNYCPVCSATQKLFKGDDNDVKQAYQIKRKEKFVGNWFVVKDPRDADKEDDSKVSGTLKLYEFPSKLEQKLKKEITDRKEGYGYEIFDPGEDGRNFIIRVLATKKDKNGKIWPDYSNSSFSRSKSAIAESDDDIQAIMDKCIEIEEYINGLKTPKPKVVDTLKAEFLWDLIMDEAVNQGYEDDGEPQPEPEKEKPKEEAKEEVDTEDAPPWDEDEEKKPEPEEEEKEAKKEEKEPEPEEEKKEEKKDDDNGDSDEDLLAELADM